VKKYCGTDLAVVIPTKDRLYQIRKLLASLSAQSTPPEIVIIVHCGDIGKQIFAEFKNRLRIQCIKSKLPGQIYQRNIGIKAALAECRLVAFLDDDIVVAHDAFERIIDFWNKVPANTAGVGFNIVNCSPFKHSLFLGFLRLSSKSPGKVLTSGYNVSIQNVAQDVQTEWLGGGFTVWSDKILRRYKQDDLRTGWAIGEDLRFSYPIGKKFPLFICSQAKVRHEHEIDQGSTIRQHFYKGYKSVASTLYFVQLNPHDFSITTCLGMLIGKCFARLSLACVRYDKDSFAKALGEAVGICQCTYALIQRTNIRTKLED
jgi:glycosyltransferase involved in cell wall biosynthesis